MFNWKKLLAKIFGAIEKPTPYIPPTCLICGKPLRPFPGSTVLMCENGHVFDPKALPKSDPVTELSKGDFHGDL